MNTKKNSIKESTEGSNKESIEEESTREETPFIIPTDIIKFIITDAFALLVDIFISIGIAIYLWKKPINLTKKIMYILSPIIISYISYKIYLYPKPRGEYIISVLTGPNPIKSDFIHRPKGSNWRFSGSAVLEYNNNDYLFIGGGEGQHDVLLKYNIKTKKFDNIIADTGLSDPNYATFSAVSFDLNNDGLNDLIVGRKNGVWLYTQKRDFKFVKTKITDLHDKVPLALSISDFNKDKKADIYISAFTPMSKYRGSIFNDPLHDRKNVLLKNTGNGFIDVTKKTNSGGLHNTFTSAFVDLNSDGYPDIVLSHDSGEIEILKNINGERFESFFPHKEKGNWMGIGVGDINNDGYPDLFLTNIGEDMNRNRVSLGDIKPNQEQAFGHKLLLNKGNFNFVEVTDDYNVSKNGFGWGAILEDLNYDGKTDLLFGENFVLSVKNRIHPGVGWLYFQEKNSKKMKRSFDFNNPHFAQTPLLADLNKDGIKDVVWVNTGGPVLGYINAKRNGNNFLNVKLPETTEFVNANVVVETNKDSRKYFRQNIQGGVGFDSDQSNIVSFGLGTDLPINLKVTTRYGKTYSLKNPKVNTTIILDNLSDFSKKN